MRTEKMNTMNETPAPAAGPGRPSRTPLKLAALAVLTLLLLIPLAMVRGVLQERLQRRDAAVCELARTWGAEQEVMGPVLVVPFKHHTVIRRETVVQGNTSFVDEVQTSTAHAYFLPKSLEVEGMLDPHILHRGIYEAVVYRGALRIAGSFDPPSFDEWAIAEEDVLWDDAYVAFGISDLRGAQDSLALKWGDRELALVPAVGLPELTSGVRALLKGLAPPSGPVAFELDLALNGSRGLRVIPVGERNEVRLRSTWADPSFQGALLPSDRRVTDDGFEAVWRASYYGRPYPQKWTSIGQPSVTRKELAASAFGVDLLSLVDHYRLVERTIKYGALFIVLVFTAFFLFELLARIRIHPFQYSLVGGALCLFYLVLLSLAEFVSFGPAYAAGAAACTGLIAIYSASALRSGWRAGAVAAELAAIYGILFVILRMQDYSLVLGTAGLFLALAIVMFTTRKIDWYDRDENA